MSTIRNGNNVKCETTHLTSFAVLVDVQDSTSSTPTVSLNDFIHYRNYVATYILGPLCHKLHWLWHINIIIAAYNACNFLLEVRMYIVT